MSMERCSQEVGATSKLAWIDVYGVPLRCWHESFFWKVGRMLGNPLLMEEETVQKNRLDRGRMLISIPFDRKCPGKIRVQDHLRPFELYIEEAEPEVDKVWIRNFLGLFHERRGSNSNPWSESERNGSPPEKVGAQDPMCQHVVDSSGRNQGVGMLPQNQKRTRAEDGKGFHNSRIASKKDAKREVNPCLSKTKERLLGGNQFVNDGMDKGKKVLQKKQRIRKRVPYRCNTAVVLEKKKRVVSSKGESSSSISGFTGWVKCPLGECSKMGQKKQKGGPGLVKPSALSDTSKDLGEVEESSGEESGPDVYGSIVPETDLEPVLCRPNYYDPILLDPLVENGRISDRGLGDFDHQAEQSHCRNSQLNRAEPIQLVVDLGPVQCLEEANGSKGGLSPMMKRRRKPRKEGSVRTHVMQTRNKKNEGIKTWYLEEELTKAIENQYNKRYGRLGANRDTLSLEIEISKVLEIGEALGFEFQGREAELSQIIAQREEKDIAKYQEMLNA